MSNDYVIARLKQWALCKKTPPHDPSRPSESLEYRMMTHEAFIRSKRKFSGGDGGLSNAVAHNRQHLAEAQREREIDDAMRLLQQRDPQAHAVIRYAFMREPGYVATGRSAAPRHELSEGAWRIRFHRGLSFIDARLVVAA